MGRRRGAELFIKVSCTCGAWEAGDDVWVIFLLPSDQRSDYSASAIIRWHWSPCQSAHTSAVRMTNLSHSTRVAFVTVCLKFTLERTYLVNTYGVYVIRREEKYTLQKISPDLTCALPTTSETFSTHPRVAGSCDGNGWVASSGRSPVRVARRHRAGSQGVSEL